LKNLLGQANHWSSVPEWPAGTRRQSIRDLDRQFADYDVVDLQSVSERSSLALLAIAAMVELAGYTRRRFSLIPRSPRAEIAP
jgi:hypothetical protein